MNNPARLRIDRAADRLVVTLDRPEIRNAIDAAMVAEIHAVCAQMEARSRVLVLTGAGGTQHERHDVVRQLEAADRPGVGGLPWDPWQSVPKIQRRARRPRS